MNRSAADFQDLVALVTLAKKVEDLISPGGNDRLSPARLIRVDHKQDEGAVEQLMSLSRKYDGPASKDGKIFHATCGSELYRIDTEAGSETLVGSVASPEMFGLEFCGTTLMGFENVDDKLVPVDVQAGGSLGVPANVGMYSLGTIVFMPLTMNPSDDPQGYD